jgi:hypothetical protein
MRCHGPNGIGEKIANFKLPNRESLSHKEKFFGVLKNGVDGTYMRSFSSRLNQSDMTSLYIYLVKYRERKNGKN